MCFASPESAFSSLFVVITAVSTLEVNDIQYNEISIPKEMLILKDLERRGIYRSLESYLMYFRKKTNSPLRCYASLKLFAKKMADERYAKTFETNNFGPRIYRPVTDSEWQSKVLDTYHMACPTRPQEPLPQGRRRFIVIESFDNYLRRAVAVQVAQELNAAKYTTPAPCLHEAMPRRMVSLRTPFYALGIYATAHIVEHLLRNRTVVVHRYWYDVAIFPLMESIRQNKYCPLQGSVLYEWPEDLLKPDIVFLLLHTNGTFNGARMSPSLRVLTPSMIKLVVEIFNRIKDVKIVQMNAALRMKFIIEDILNTIRNMFPEYRTGQTRMREANPYHPPNRRNYWN